MKFPVWFDDVGAGGTPMVEAFQLANIVLVKWLMQHPNCFPPIVINISDGESTDGDPYPGAQDLMTLFSSDGGVLLFNLHLSSSSQSPIEYPDSEVGLPDDYAKGSLICPAYCQNTYKKSLLRKVFMYRAILGVLFSTLI